jgi:hypothetical protein
MAYAWETIGGIVAVVVMFGLFWLYTRACDRL